MNLKNLPPTSNLAQGIPSTLQELQAENLSLRLLVATLVWKAGGKVDVYPADIELATMTRRLHAIPLDVPGIPKGATRWSVEEFVNGKKGNG